MARILIVEDDPQITKILTLNLKLSGHEPESTSTFQEAWSRICTTQYEVVLMDIGLPDGSGLDLCKKIRENGIQVPVVFLSARTDEASVVKAITNGADDYLRKPFGLEELKVRVGKFVQKISPKVHVVKFGELTIDPARRVATVMDKILSLGRKELDILTLLARKSGDVLTRESILDSLYGNADLYDRTVDSHMSHLRRKLREAAGPALKIVSVYGLGYRLEWKTQ